MIKKSIALIAVVSILFSCVGNLVIAVDVEKTEIIYENDFENYVAGEKPTDLILGEGGGKVSVAELNENKCLFVKNDFDGMYSFIKKPLFDQDKSMYIISFDFMQVGERPLKTTVLECRDKTKSVFWIECNKDNNIILCNQNGESCILIENYYPNVWYNFSISVDTADEVCTVTVDRDKNQSISIEGIDGGLIEMSSQTAYSPGFCIDNILVKTMQKPNIIEIYGDDRLAIPSKGEKEYIYEARIFDDKGNPIDDEDIEFNVEPADVNYSIKDDSLIITIPAGATEMMITVSAKSKAFESISAIKTVNTVPVQISDLKIVGQNKLAYSANGSSKYQYKCICNDQNGEDMQDVNVQWAISGDTDNISLNEKTGEISVNGEVSNGKYIVLKVFATEAPAYFCEKKIALLDQYSYRKDKYRFDAVIKYAEKVFIKAADIWHKTPLLANGLNVRSDYPATFEFVINENQLHDTILYNNLAGQVDFMRGLYGISNLTGDEKYKKIALDNYQYYIDHYFDSNSNLFKFGGHACVDLYTGDSIDAMGNEDTHELKDNFIFMDPLFELNPDIAAKYLKGTFVGHFSSADLLSNRHAIFSNKYDETEYSNLDLYDEKLGKSPTQTHGVPFRSAGNDFMYNLILLYNNTGDEKALVWAKRILDRYNNLRNAETHIGVDTYADLTYHDTLIPLPKNWWLFPNYMDYTGSQYGDMAYNQFADDLIADGIFQESQRDVIRQRNLINYNADTIYGSGVIIELMLAKALAQSGNISESEKVISECIQSYASYLKYAYMPEKNMLSYIWNDGTSMNGYVIKKNGYYGSAGSVIAPQAVKPTIAYAALLLLDYQNEFVQEDDFDVICKFLNNYMKANGIFKSDMNSLNNVEINDSITSSNPELLMVLCKYYEITNDIKILNAARCIGNNIVENNIVNDYFVSSSGNVFTNINNKYFYGLIILDAAISRDFDAVPENYFCDMYFQSYIKDNRGRDIRRKDIEYIWPSTFPAVQVTSIEPIEKTIIMQPGETKKIEFTLKPYDASSKTVYWYSGDAAVVIVGNNNEITALKQGKTILYGKSSNLRAETSIEVVVEENGNNDVTETEAEEAEEE